MMTPSEPDASIVNPMFHSCVKCASGLNNVVCVSKYRHSVYKALGLPVVSCALPAACGLNCGMPAAFDLIEGVPVLTQNGYCGPKHYGYIVSGAWRSAQLRILNTKLEALLKKEQDVKNQIDFLTSAMANATVTPVTEVKLKRWQQVGDAVKKEIQYCNDQEVAVMDSALEALRPDSPPRG